MGKAGAAVLRVKEGAGDGGDEIDPPDEAPRERSDQPVPDVGAVEADQERPGSGKARTPANQAVVGVDEVKALSPQQAPQAPSRGQVLVAAGGEFEADHLDPTAFELADLVPYPATPLRRTRVRHKIGHDQHAHAGEANPGPT